MNTRPSAKRLQASQRLRDLIETLPQGTRLPTVRALCRQHGLAMATMSRILHDLQNEGLILRRPRSGLFTGTSVNPCAVGIVIGNNIFTPGYTPYWSLLLHAAFRIAGEYGLRCLSYMEDQGAAIPWARHSQLLSDIQSGTLHGLLTLSAPSRDLLAQLRAAHLPIVALTSGGGGEWRVESDMPAWIGGCVSAMAERGARRIALLCINPKPVPNVFSAAIRRVGLTVEPRLIWIASDWWEHLDADSSAPLPVQIIDNRWKTLDLVGKRPDGIVIEDDAMACTIIDTLEARGVRVGHDIQIAARTTRYSPVLAPYANRIIMAETDADALARTAYDMLTTLMAGKQPAAAVGTVQPRILLPRSTDATQTQPISNKVRSD